VTSVARTLLDLAGVVRLRLLERAIDQAERLQIFDLRAIQRLKERNPRRCGQAALDQVLTYYAGPAPTRSELEQIFLHLCRRAQLSLPAVNCFIAGFEVDIAWIDRRVIVELDGYRYHGTRLAFERDRSKDAALQVAGYRVLRVTYRRLMREPEGVVADLRALLAA
jgi:very-short-patch-repair endonuclease